MERFVYKKIRRLLIPYLIFGILGGMVWSVCNYGINNVNILEILKDLLLQQRYLIVWYIMMIFLLEILMYFPIKYIKNDKFLIICSIILYILGRIWFYFNNNSKWILNLDTCLTCQLWFTLGYLCKKNNWIIVIKKKLVTLIFLSISMIILGGINYIVCGEELNIFGNNYALPFITEIAALTGIAFIINLSMMINFDFIKFIGKNSLVFMLMHQIIIQILQLVIFKKWIQPLNNIIGAIITFCICILLITALIKIIEQIKRKLKLRRDYA